MTHERRLKIVGLLEDSAFVFDAAATGVPRETAALSPAPDRWSVFEIVEHVAVAENGMFRLLSGAKPAEASAGNPTQGDPEKEALLAARLGNREFRGQAPDRAKPTGRFGTLDEALGAFTAARQQTIRFARETEIDLCSVTAAHPLFGEVNGYELLLIMAGHARRHADQIEEVKQSVQGRAPRE